MASPYRNPGRNLDPGDETREHGDYIGREDVADDVPAGAPVTITPGGTVVASEGNDVHAILSIPHETESEGDNIGTYRERATLKMHGAVLALVQSDTEQGDLLGAANVAEAGETDGNLGTGSTGAGRTIIALEDAQELELEDGSTVFVAEVHLS